MKNYTLLSAFSAIIFMFSCQNIEKNLSEMNSNSNNTKTVEITYRIDTIQFDGFVAYDSSFSGIRPVVLVIPEWWGLHDYAKRRAIELSRLGYISMAVDLYGNGRRGLDPKSAGALAGPFYQNPNMAQSRFHYALEQVKKFKEADSSRIAAIGYCFGGAMVLNMARLGENLKGVVSFHGNLRGVPATKESMHAQILVLHGDSDQFVGKEEVMAFKNEMDSLGLPYIFKSYPGATHAFTNPDATATGIKFGIPIAYNAAADTASFKEMSGFLSKIFK